MVPLFKNSLIVCVFNIFGESSNELVKQGTFCFIPPLVFSYIIKGPDVEFLFKGGGCHFRDLLSSAKVWESSGNIHCQQTVTSISPLLWLAAKSI